MVNYKVIAQRVIDALNDEEIINSEREFTNGKYVKLSINDYSVFGHYSSDPDNTDVTIINATINNQKYELIKDDDAESWTFDFPEAKVFSDINGIEYRSNGLKIQVHSVGFRPNMVTQIYVSTVDSSSPNKKTIAVSALFNNIESLEASLD